jgi:uncharacterized RDD family membrane protein YckC
MSDDLIRVPTGLTTDGLIGRRYLARIIDTVILALLAGTVILLLAVVMQPIGHWFRLLLSLSVLLVIWIAYGALLESSPWQATLGKRCTGLRVYNSAGGRLTMAQAASRGLVKDGPFFLVSGLPFGNVLSLVWIGCHLVVLHRSPVYQAIHDKAAKTWVASPEGTTQLHLT